MRARILAAGRARRLGAPGPKCLVDVGGRSLLARMLAALTSFVDEAVLVVGHEAPALRAAALALPDRPALSFVHNPEFERGSLLSLARGAARFGEDELLLMDADVLFPRALLARLVREAPPDAFLLDPRSTSGGEEMMLVARAGRVRRIARRVTPGPEDVVGEGVGFLKLTRAAQRALGDELARQVDLGRGDRDYEDALDAVLPALAVGYAEVADLPWTEVDFPADLERARALAPEVDALDGAA